MEEIINRVANSSLEVFDLEDFYQIGNRTSLDLSQFLHDGFILKEKDFRAQLQAFDWSIYQNHFVSLTCSTDAILPAWASILVTLHLAPFAKKVIIGSLQELESSIFQEILSTFDFSIYKDKAVIIKGCSKKPVPENAYLIASQMLMPYAKSIMYGEACSAVPLYKRK